MFDLAKEDLAVKQNEHFSNALRDNIGSKKITLHPQKNK